MQAGLDPQNHAQYMGKARLAEGPSCTHHPVAPSFPGVGFCQSCCPKGMGRQLLAPSAYISLLPFPCGLQPLLLCQALHVLINQGVIPGMPPLHGTLVAAGGDAWTIFPFLSFLRWPQAKVSLCRGGKQNLGLYPSACGSHVFTLVVPQQKARTE